METTLPSAFLKLVVEAPGGDAVALQKALQGDAVTSIRIHPDKYKLEKSHTVRWNAHGYYLKERPVFTLDPAFHAGLYYVQEASSMFLEVALKQALADIDGAPTVLDLCAAPGGKSTLAASLIKEKGGLLVANEIHVGRSSVLAENIVKWGTGNVVVTNNKPSDFSGMEGFFDIIIVDAPCSGEGLFRKDEAAIREWSDGHTKGCALRQQDILRDIWPSLKTNGTLIYSTCTYNTRENEENARWLIDEMQADPVQLPMDAQSGIYESASGYRFWPYRTEGEGFYLNAFRKNEGVTATTIKHKAPKNISTAGKKEASEVSDWLNGDYTTVQFQNYLIAVPTHQLPLVHHLAQTLRIKYFGTTLGSIGRKGIIPDHALVMASNYNKAIFPVLETDYFEALSYLSGNSIPTNGAKDGWYVVKYNGANLGLAKVIGRRINNYYPKNLRIRMDWKKLENDLEPQADIANFMR